MNLTRIKLQCYDIKLTVTTSPDTIHFKCSVWTSFRITQLETKCHFIARHDTLQMLSLDISSDHTARDRCLYVYCIHNINGC
jgi:hypothetical protein